MITKPLLILLALFLLGKLLTLPPGGGLTIKVFDVGQGDAILIKTPNGFLVLIDGGPDFEVDRYIDKEFWLNGCHLDLLVLTHPHADHLKGLNRLLERCKVDTVLHRTVEYDSRGYENWFLHLSSVEVREAKTGDVISLGRVKLVVVWPPEQQEFSENINNSSVSLLLDYGDFEALFLGDLEKEASIMLDTDTLDRYIDGKLEVYKVPHHGSIDSFNPVLISYLAPKLCLVPVGENKYGHPNDEVLEFMRGEGCAIKRTDESGTIELFIN